MKNKPIIILSIVIVLLLIITSFLTFLLLQKRDISVSCYDFVGEEQYECLVKVAYLKSNKEICYKIPNDQNYSSNKRGIGAHYRANCLVNLAYQKRDAEICNEIDTKWTPFEKDQCFFHVAEVLRDPYLCDNIESIGGLKERCVEGASSSSTKVEDVLE